MNASRHIEQEARFLVSDPDLHRALAHLETVGRFRLVSRRRERQRNTYFDTAQLHLRRGGSVLKLRQVGRSREVIFKHAVGYHRGVATHLEVAVPVTLAQRQQLPNGRLRAEPLQRARRLAGAAPLRALLTIATDRRRHCFAQGRQRVELDIDRVTLRQGSRVVAQRFEVELENLTASSAAFHAALQALRRQFGRALRPSAVSKFEFALAALTAARRDA